MSSKIFKAVWLAAVSVFLASLVFIMGISYTYFSDLQKKQLKNEAELAARGAALSGTEYFEGLEAERIRITWIDGDGNVVYDSEADTGKMGNHLERTEVKEALETGFGEAVRYSATLADRELYAARRLPGGSVLRLSIVQAAVWTLILGFAQPCCIVIFIALILSLALASRLARRIVEPINGIDPEHPERYYGKENYIEVEPLLRHIAAQRAQIREDREQIERTALIRQEFTANVSHELKTPLQAISGYAELIENGMAGEEDIRPFAHRIRLEALRMTDLVSDIIDLTRLDQGGGDMQWERCDLYRIALNAADSLESAAAAGNITLSVEGVPAPMTGVSQVLYSIVYDLCDNAVKYNRPGGFVRVSVARDGENAVLKVSDSGIGIPEESRERIFERFYRVDKGRSKEAGGTGLGLSIVKHGVMIHRGTITVASRPGGGSEFTVTLPGDRTARGRLYLYKEESEI